MTESKLSLFNPFGSKDINNAVLATNEIPESKTISDYNDEMKFMSNHQDSFQVTGINNMLDLDYFFDDEEDERELVELVRYRLEHPEPPIAVTLDEL